MFLRPYNFIATIFGGVIDKNFCVQDFWCVECFSESRKFGDVHQSSLLIRIQKHDTYHLGFPYAVRLESAPYRTSRQMAESPCEIFFQHNIFTNHQFSELNESFIVAKNAFRKGASNPSSVLCISFTYLLRFREIMWNSLREKLIFCHYFVDES